MGEQMPIPSLLDLVAECQRSIAFDEEEGFECIEGVVLLEVRIRRITY